MALTYLKRAARTPSSGEDDTRATVEKMLRELEQGREETALEYTRRLDGFSGEVLVSPEAIERAGRAISQKLKDDIRFAYDRVRSFAEHQRQSLGEFEVELSPGT
jgi:sulfopropanediol 3-dehydrogenase